METLRSARELDRKHASAASPSTVAISFVSANTRRDNPTASLRDVLSVNRRINRGLLRTNATRLAFPCAATTHNRSIHSSKISGARRKISPPDSSTWSAAPPPRSRKSLVRVSNRVAFAGDSSFNAAGNDDQDRKSVV